MPRQRLTIKRVDPWSVMKFGFLTNLSLLGVGLVGAGTVWVVAAQLGLIEKACSVAEQFGVQNCGISGGSLFRALLLLGLLGVIVTTGLAVFLSFLFNLVSDLVGGMEITVVDRARSSSRVPARPAPGTDVTRAEPLVDSSPRGAEPEGTGEPIFGDRGRR